MFHPPFDPIRAACAAALALALLVPVARADGDAAHRAAAVAVHELTRSDDPDRVAAALSSMVIGLDPGLANQRDEISAFARELVASPAFAKAAVDTLIEYFDESELRALAKVFATPAYQRYRDRRLDLVRSNTERVIALVRSKLPELRRRLDEARERDAAR